MKKFGTFALVGGLVLALFAAAMPTAAAHTCADHYSCDAGACKDGEYHDHTDYNADEEDGYCHSDPYPPEEGCYYFGQKWPPRVCDVIQSASNIVSAIPDPVSVAGGVAGSVGKCVPTLAWSVPPVGSFIPEYQSPCE